MSHLETLASDPIAFNKIQEMITNASSSRSELLKTFMDPRRNLNDECGYPDTKDIDANTYKDMYDREPVATRVVQLMPQECWKVSPDIYEDENAETETEFEKAWDSLATYLRVRSWYKDQEGNPVWEHLYRADVLCGLGHFGILLIGIDDGKDLAQPVEGVTDGRELYSTTVQGDGSTQAVDVKVATETSTTAEGIQPTSLEGTDAQYNLTQFYVSDLAKPSTQETPKAQARKLLFLRSFDESLVQITQYENDPTSPRYGQPVMYLVTLNDPNEKHSGTGLPMASVHVHWTRVIHLADNLGSSEVFGVPRMRPVFNPLMDIRKVRGGSAEMYWRGAFPGISLETHPQLGGDVSVDTDAVQDTMENYMNGLQRYLLSMGMSAKTLAPQVVDPTAQINIQIDCVCIQLGIPVRIFKGSERGELSSTEDKGQWNEVVHGRQVGFVSPRIVVPFIDRLIQMNVLPVPALGYHIKWPDMNSLTRVEQATIAVQETQALSAYVSGGVEAVVAPKDYLTRVLKWTDEAADATLQTATDAIETPESTNSPLLSMVGGMTGMLELFKGYSEGAMSRDTLKQSLVMFFKLSEADAEDLIADSEPAPAPAPTPSFQKVREGETLLDGDGTVVHDKVATPKPIVKPAIKLVPKQSPKVV